MSISFIGAERSEHYQVSSPPQPVPDGVAELDFMLATITADGAGTAISLPSGFTVLYDGDVPYDAYGPCRLVLGYRIAGASEPSSYTFSSDADEQLTTSICVWRGVDINTPIEGFDFNSDSASVPLPPCPSVNTAIDGCAVVTEVSLARGVLSSAMDPLDNYTPPASSVEVVDVNEYAGSGYTGHAVGWETQNTAGATPTLQWQHAGDSWGGLAITVALRPANGDPGGTTKNFSANVIARAYSQAVFDFDTTYRDPVYRAMPGDNERVMPSGDLRKTTYTVQAAVTPVFRHTVTDDTRETLAGNIRITTFEAPASSVLVAANIDAIALVSSAFAIKSKTGGNAASVAEAVSGLFLKRQVSSAITSVASAAASVNRKIYFSGDVSSFARVQSNFTIGAYTGRKNVSTTVTGTAAVDGITTGKKAVKAGIAANATVLVRTGLVNPVTASVAATAFTVGFASQRMELQATIYVETSARGSLRVKGEVITAPDKRTYKIEPEDRIITIAFMDRTLIVDRRGQKDESF